MYTDDPGRLRRARQHLARHPPRRQPLRRPRRRALPGLQPRLLRPPRPRARVGARVHAVRRRVPGRPVARPAARALDRAAAQRPHLRHDGRARPSPRPTSPTTTSRSGGWSQAVSHSPFWPNTAILVTEDDAQNGPDHVDAHRTLAYVISPYTQTGEGRPHALRHGGHGRHGRVAAEPAADDDLDQRATRMWKGFSRKPNFRPYDALMPKVIPFGAEGAPVNAPTRAAGDGVRAVELQRSRTRRRRSRSTRRSGSPSTGGASDMPAPRHDYIIGSQPADPSG